MNRFLCRMVLWNLVGFLAVSAFFILAFLHKQEAPWIHLAALIGIPACWLLPYIVSLFFVSVLAACLNGIALLSPLRSLNRQLQQIGPHNLDRRVHLEQPGAESAALQEHINNLLSGTNLALIQLKQYAAQVAHELRSPLTLIRLKIEQAADKIDPTLGEEIQTELLRLNIHVEQSLFVARAEQGHLALNRTRFDLSHLLQDVADDFRLLAEEQYRTVSCDAASVPIDADSKYVRQVLYALLTNALRHGSGTIRIHLLQSGVLRIINRSKPPEFGENDLGLGRRIVSALLGLHGDIRMRSRRYKNFYATELVFRVVE